MKFDMDENSDSENMYMIKETDEEKTANEED